ncbi:MAG: hypothetical protein WDO19_20450 [Bacteroidota bacterium]
MKKAVSIVLLVFMSIFFITGCAEHRYYVKNHDHSPRYYRHHPHRHHHDVDVHIRN